VGFLILTPERKTGFFVADINISKSFEKNGWGV